MTFNVQKCNFCTQLSKNIYRYCGRGTQLPTPPPPLCWFAPSLWPPSLFKNPGYATDKTITEWLKWKYFNKVMYTDNQKKLITAHFTLNSVSQTYSLSCTCECHLPCVFYNSNTFIIHISITLDWNNCIIHQAISNHAGNFHIKKLYSLNCWILF